MTLEQLFNFLFDFLGNDEDDWVYIALSGRLLRTRISRARWRLRVIPALPSRPSGYDWALREHLYLEEYISPIRWKRYGKHSEEMVRNWLERPGGQGSSWCQSLKYGLSQPTVMNIIMDVAEHVPSPMSLSKVLGCRFSGILMVDGKPIPVMSEKVVMDKKVKAKSTWVVLTLLDGLTEDRLSRVVIPSEASEYVGPVLREFRDSYGVPAICLADLGLQHIIEELFPRSIYVPDSFHLVRRISEALGGKSERTPLQKRFFSAARRLINARRPDEIEDCWREVKRLLRDERLQEDARCLKALKLVERYFPLIGRKARVLEMGLPPLFAIGALENVNRSLAELLRRLGGAFHSARNAQVIINLWTAYERTRKFVTGHLKGFSPLTAQGLPEMDWLALALNSSKLVGS